MENNINKVGVFLSVFITIIVGIILLSVVSDSTYDATTLQESVNETIVFTGTVGYINTTNTAQDDIISVTNFDNLTDDLTANIDTDINWTKAGVITVSRDVVGTNNSFNISYNFEGDNYVAHSTSRTLIKLLVLFFALALLGIAIYAMNQMGIMELLK